MDFRLLGPLEVVDDEGHHLPPAPPKQQALLAALLLHANEVVSVDRLVWYLWREDPPEDGPGALRYHVSQLRRALASAPGGAGAISTRAGGYVMEVEPTDVDTSLFEMLVRRARSAQDPRDRLELLDRAHALWRGDAYAEFTYDEFAQGEIRRLHELRLAAEEDRLEELLSSDRDQEAVERLQQLVMEHPLRERMHGLLMLGLYRMGRQADALRAYQGARRNLAEQLGIEPSGDLQRLEERILLNDTALRGDTAAPSNLPYPMVELVGRIAELTQVSERLITHRMLTLSGPAGVGKSRLALQAAHQLVPRFPDGVWLIELAPLQSPDQAVSLMSRIIGRERGSGQPAEADLVQELSGRHALVVLDNCEHLVSGVSQLATRLLEKLPNLRILATSREALHLPGESVLSLEPLSSPDTEIPAAHKEIAEFDAVKLFCARASEVDPAFALTDGNARAVARVCGRLDGLPLALELAAGCLRTLTPSEIDEHLADRFRLLVTGGASRPPHHHSLESAIGWSCGLLDPMSRSLFSRLSAFFGSFNLPAIEAICTGGDIKVAQVLPLLIGLVDRSLVAPRAGPGESRYHVLESLREFGRRDLRDAGELETIAQRHAEYFAQWAADHGGLLHWPQNEAAVHTWKSEHANLGGALTWALEAGQAELALQIASDSWRYWFVSGTFEEGLTWMELALAAAGSPRGLLGIRALNGAGALARATGDHATSQSYFMHAIALAVDEPDPEAQSLLASALTNLAERRRDVGDYQGSASLQVEALRLAEQYRHPHLDTAHTNYGWTALAMDDLGTAADEFLRVSELETYGDSGAFGTAILKWLAHDLPGAAVELDRFFTAGGNLDLGKGDGHLLAALLARDEGRPADALDHLARGLGPLRRVGSDCLSRTAALAWWLRIAATVHIGLGHRELAARIAGAATEAQERSAGVVVGWQQRDFDHQLDAARTRLGDAGFSEAWEVGRTLTIDDACLEALRPVEPATSDY